MNETEKAVAEVLLKAEAITREQLDSAVRFKNQNGMSLEDAMVRLRYAGEAQVAQALSKVSGMPFASRGNNMLRPEDDPELRRLVDKVFAVDNMCWGWPWRSRRACRSPASSPPPPSSRSPSPSSFAEGPASASSESIWLARRENSSQDKLDLAPIRRAVLHPITLPPLLVDACPPAGDGRNGGVGAVGSRPAYG
ncbi:MAG: hypothetical protein HYV15_03785 [Elusimicrobia bacterium]|nr:hypothetical protein [Elusimicrobiota bacterium]